VVGRLPLAHQVGAGAERLAIKRIVVIAAILEERGGVREVVRGQDEGLSHIGQEGCEDLLSMEDDGVVVRGIRARDVVKPGRGGGIVLGIHDLLVGEDDVLGRERLAVGPPHAVAQVEGVRQFIAGDAPACGQVGSEVPLRVRPDEQIEDGRREIAGGLEAGNVGVERIR